jgi:poly-gamma-glutamate synthesis protein (capsule biosynthesis protein)
LKAFPYILILFLTGLFPGNTVSQTGDTLRLSLVFAGDIMGHDEQVTGARDSITGKYNYEPVFQYVKPLLEKADLAIGNLEVTLAGPPYKGYPQFSSPDALATAARDAGFDVFIQANNHALDRGRQGFKRTLAVLDSLGVEHTGTFADSADRANHYPLMLQKNGIKIALLNYTYGTNGLEIPKPYIINRIDPVQMRADLLKAKARKPDFVIVTIHWGEEYQRVQNKEQEYVAGLLFQYGADFIIGSHPHVIQPVVVTYAPDSTVKNLVLYSLGNFVSNQRAQYKDGGILFSVNLYKTPKNKGIASYGYTPTWVFRNDRIKPATFTILPVCLYEKDSTLLPLVETDRYKIARFAKDTREHLKGVSEIR